MHNDTATTARTTTTTDTPDSPAASTRRPARRARVWAAGLLAAGALGAGLAGPAAADTPGHLTIPGGLQLNCTIDCVQNLSWNRTGTELTASFTSLGNVRSELRIAETVAGLDAANVKKSVSQGYTGIHHRKVSGLSPGKIYRYRITATDLQGNVHTEQGVVITKRRQIRWTIDDIWVMNDSDSSGPGEITAHLHLDPFHEAPKAVYNQTYSDLQHIDTDYGVTYSYSGFENPAIAPKVQLADDDCDVFCGDFEPPISSPTWNTGSDSDADWAYASGWFDPDSYNTAGTYFETFDVFHQVGYDGLNFEVKMRIDVGWVD